MSYTSESLRGYGKMAFERDRWTCRYCGLDCSSFELYPLLSVDHVIPRQQQNQITVDIDDERNLVTCCRACNSFGNRKKYTIPQSIPFERQVEVVFRAKKELIAERREEWRKFYDENVKPRLNAH